MTRGRRTKPATWTTPSAMAADQNTFQTQRLALINQFWNVVKDRLTHRQLVLAAIQAPAIGPMAGPVKGASVYNDVANLYYQRFFEFPVDVEEARMADELTLVLLVKTNLISYRHQ